MTEVPRSTPAPLQPGDSFRHAALVAMLPQVRRLLDLEPALRKADATEDLKRYRVATRRLRAAFRAFDGALPKRAEREIQPELAELARAVGKVRDLDVRMTGLAAWAEERGSRASDEVAPLRAAWEAERAEAAADVERRLGTKRHARLLVDLSELVEDEDGARKPGAGRSVGDRAASTIWAAFERLRSSASDLDGADIETLHDVRILAKRLRYTLEFLTPVLGSDRDWLVARLVELQDHLGALNDADLAASATRAFLESDATTITDEQRAAIEGFAASRADIVARLRAAAPKVAVTSVSAAFARRLSRAVLGPSA